MTPLELAVLSLGKEFCVTTWNARVFVCQNEEHEAQKCKVLYRLLSSQHVICIQEAKSSWEEICRLLWRKRKQWQWWLSSEEIQAGGCVALARRSFTKVFNKVSFDAGSICGQSLGPRVCCRGRGSVVAAVP